MSEREMETLVAQLERLLGLSWSDVVEWLRDVNPADAIERRLIERGLSGTLILKVPDAAARFADTLHDAYVRSGQRAMTWLDDRVPDALIRFDQTNYRAVAKAEAQRYELIRGFTSEQRDVARRVVSEGLREGVNPRVQAKALRESIGLTDYQSKTVANYRRELESGDFSAAMKRELSDGRSDKLLRRLRSEGGALSQEQVDAMVERYRKNWVNYRAETIARTESLRAVHQGHDEAMRQAVDRGDVEAGQLENEWHSGRRTKNSRDQHLAMNGVRVPYGEKFVLPDGTRMTGPGDPSAGAEHTANCRCTRSTSFAITPAGFTADGARIVQGLPKRSDLQDDVVYALKPSQIRDKLIALPGGGNDRMRLQSIVNAWTDGKRLKPVHLMMTESGDLYVGDGRHRLLTALEQNRPVLARIEKAAPGTEQGTVPLKMPRRDALAHV